MNEKEADLLIDRMNEEAFFLGAKSLMEGIEKNILIGVSVRDTLEAFKMILKEKGL